MKKFKTSILLTIAFIFSGSVCFGANVLNLNAGSDYLISTEKPKNASSIQHPDVILLSQLCTIFNEKNSLILHPARVGQSRLILMMDSGRYEFDVNVGEKNKLPQKITQYGIFEITEIDEPPMMDDDFKIDAPPTDLPTLRGSEKNCTSADSPVEEAPEDASPELNNRIEIPSEPQINTNTEAE